MIIIELHLRLFGFGGVVPEQGFLPMKTKFDGMVHCHSEGLVGDGNSMVAQTFFLQVIVEALNTIRSQIHQIYVSNVWNDVLFYGPTVCDVCAFGIR